MSDEQTAALKAANKLLRKGLEDFRDNGTRFDLNPTVILKNDIDSIHRFYLGYLKRMDRSVREVARAILLS